ncbi:MAG: UDP-N-acetylmuramate dehydrogenase [Bacteroidia bacterium]
MLQPNVSLKPYNTFHIEASARFFRTIDSEQGLVEFLMDNSHAMPPFIVLGGGSNILFTSDVDAVVLKNEIRGIELMEEDEASVLIRVGGGEVWHELVMHCVEKGWGGIENLALIPGSVGAAPIQNIGAYGVELKEVFEKLEAIHLSTGGMRTFDARECAFGYRDSIFKRSAKGKYFISRVWLRLQKAPHKPNTSYAGLSQALEEHGVSQPSIRDIAEAVIAVRRSKLPDPAEIGNSGSFFKNPVITSSQFDQIKGHYPDIPHYPQADGSVKLPAAWLIDQSGWKGFREGDYGVHDRQALVLVNHGNASGKEIYDLSERILQDVENRFGIKLEREVNVISDF